MMDQNSKWRFVSAFSILIFLVFEVGNCSNLQVLYSPSYVTAARLSSQLPSSMLPDIVSHVLGFKQNTELSDVLVTDLWKRPESVVVVEVDGNANFKTTFPVIHSYKLQVDGIPQMSTAFDLLKSEFADQQYTLVDEKSRTPHGSTVHSPVDNSNLWNTTFGAELASAREVLQWIAHEGSFANGVPDIYYFRFTGLLNLEQELADSSALVKDAQEALSNFIAELNDTFVKAYNGNTFLMLAWLEDVPHLREARQIRKQSQSKSSTSSNSAANGQPVQTDKPRGVGQFYDPNYPAMFNIFFFVCLGFFIAILGIGIWIWFLDPDRESIIYRMTATRQKKD